MIKYVDIFSTEVERSCTSLLEVWADPSVKVVVARPDIVPDDVKEFYESIFPLLGTPAAYAEDARISDRTRQRTGEIWMEIRFDPSIQNAYRHSSQAQPLHTDGSYIPGFPNSSLLCCVTNAAEGGETVFIDSKDLVDTLIKEKPDLYSKLVNKPIPHARSGDRRDDFVLKKNEGNWYVNWNYYCVSPELDDERRTTVEEFHEFLNFSPSVKHCLVPIKLEPGEAVMWKDNEVLHGRNDFKASSAGERFIWKCAFDVGVF
tara:strand:+ start:1045 stop:1824 length:780 start_codon:yes stop_codon:yes gene_type:complete